MCTSNDTAVQSLHTHIPNMQPIFNVHKVSTLDLNNSAYEEFNCANFPIITPAISKQYSIYNDAILLGYSG